MATSTLDRPTSGTHSGPPQGAPVVTGKVKGRRELKFESLDQILKEAERIAAARSVKQLGNWSPGQVFAHLAYAMNMSIDGAKSQPPWFVKLIGPLMKKRVLRHMSAGFTLPPNAAAELVFGPTSTQDGLNALRSAIHRQKSESKRVPSVVFGKFTHDEWNQLHFRHAELHLSFLDPG
ncbi:MAG: DUF1569 domain-containing protein [Planctomycetes bacterium]|nr:DUF1569 domain-containing protein [Planctomycetota bacterium]